MVLNISLPKMKPSFGKDLLVKSTKLIEVLSSTGMRNSEIFEKSHTITTGLIRDPKVANYLEEPTPNWQ